MTDDDVIASIVEDLRPFQRRWTQANVHQAVREKLTLLQGEVPKFFDRNATIRTRSDARDIKRSITKLRQQLSKASPELKERFIHHDLLPAVLAKAEGECDLAISGTLGDGRRDHVKKWCAHIAYGLIVRYSMKEPASGSSNSPLRHIAGLLYGRIGASGRPTSKDQDFKRACDEVLRAMRRAVQITAGKSSDL